MKTILFFLAILASVVASATVKVTPISTDYASQKVTFKVEWTNSPNAPYNNRVWVWIDFCPITGTTPGGFSPATITGATITSGSGSTNTLTGRGFFIAGSTTNAGTTVTATLNPVPAGQFNWCVYGSDYPPNVLANTNGSYTLAGTPPFELITTNGATTHTVNEKTVATSAVTITPATITDATGYPGLWCPYTGSDLYMDATHRCRERQSGAYNWEAYIKDVRDNQIYRIVQMPTGTWWMAEDLMWDGRPNSSATGYTVRGVARNCAAHYGCGRFYNNTSTGAGAYAGTATARRSSDICPNGWLIPSTDELCPVASYNSTDSPYIAADEFAGPDTYGLSLRTCSAWAYVCGIEGTAYVGGSGASFNWLRTGTGGACGDARPLSGARTVRCVRSL